MLKRAQKTLGEAESGRCFHCGTRYPVALGYCRRCEGIPMVYFPPKSLIEKEKLKIQAGWTPAERLKRTQQKPVPVETESCAHENPRVFFKNRDD